MRKRFKFRSKKRSTFKVIIFLVIGYIIFSLLYRTLYKNYINKMNNQEFINHVIRNINNNESLIDKYKNPEYILKHTLNINMVKKELPVINTETNKENVQVFIYNTHETEEYSDNYLEHYNIIPNVKTMSYILKDNLEDLGINATVEENSVVDILRQNNWSYSKSYSASRMLIEEKIKTNNYKLIIDLHRDSSSLEKTLLEYNNKKYARILFVIGTEHQNYEANYLVSQKISEILNNEIPNISRGIIKKSGAGVNGVYNEDLNPNLILIELGGPYNQIEELTNTIDILSKTILKYLEGD